STSPLAIRVGGALPDPEAGRRREAGLKRWPAWPGPVVVERGDGPVRGRELDPRSVPLAPGVPDFTKRAALRLAPGVPDFTKRAAFRPQRTLQLTERVQSPQQAATLKAAEGLRVPEGPGAVPPHPLRQPCHRRISLISLRSELGA